MKKIIIAHRGNSAYERDNLMESFDKAVERGVDMIEFDLRKTKDGIYIAYHDRRINGRKIKNLEYFQLNKFVKYNVVKVQDIFKKHKNKIKFDIDLKERGYEEDLIKFLDKYMDIEDIFITSRFLDSLKKIKKIKPNIKLGLIRFFSFFRSINICLENNFEYIVLNYFWLNNKFLNYAQFKRIKVLVWTVNYPYQIKKYLKNNRIAGVITNKPNVALNIKKSLAEL